MNITETTALITWQKIIKPAQEFDDLTPRAWQPILRDVSVDDARAVVVDLARTASWIDPNDIVAAARRLRRERLTTAGFTELAPNVDPDNPAGWIAERRALREAIASGQLPAADVPRYEAGEIPPLTGAEPLVTQGAVLVSKPIAKALAAVAKRRSVPA